MEVTVVNGMRIQSDFTESVFSKLTQVGPAFGSKCVIRALFLCECGTYCTPRIYDVFYGKTTSCGCHKSKTSSATFSTHRMTKSPEYTCWRAMCERCTNPKNSTYSYYGGRGITIASEWLGRDGFTRWLGYIGRMPKPKMTQDRIDVNGNYEPGNVKWASRKEQGGNRRVAKCKKLEINGVSLSYSEWSKQCGIKHTTIQERIRRGWTPERAISTPVKFK